MRYLAIAVHAEYEQQLPTNVGKAQIDQVVEIFLRAHLNGSILVGPARGQSALAHEAGQYARNLAGAVCTARSSLFENSYLPTNQLEKLFGFLHIWGKDVETFLLLTTPAISAGLATYVARKYCQLEQPAFMPLKPGQVRVLDLRECRIAYNPVP